MVDVAVDAVVAAVALEVVRQELAVQEALLVVVVAVDSGCRSCCRRRTVLESMELSMGST